MRATPLFALLALSLPAFAAEGVPLNDAERAFTARMSGATLVGSFTIDGADPGEDARLRPERYDLGKVEKLPNGQWQWQTRIRYGDKDITLPIMLPLEWVATEGGNPTPVVVVDNVAFPGAGTYSARVLFHDGAYAGRWSGATHGGSLFGRIVPKGESPAPAEPGSPE